MSAIFGILRFDGGDASARELERMGNVLAHRSPDGRKTVTDGPIGLGNCLMRVNHEDLHEVQPLRDRDTGAVLVADLRLDNREELAEAFGIGAADLSDMPDSALVMRAYKTWGEDCAEHLLGDFAFALWDGRARKLILARDHMGQRDIHYHLGKDFLAFATEIWALWAVEGVPQVLSEAQIGRRLMGVIASAEGKTWFEGIEGLPGATIMSVGADGAVARRSYWEPRADPVHEGRDEAYYAEAYRRVLGEAVACRIRRAARPPGIFFSGGYDSAAIAGLAGPVLAESGRRLFAAASVMPADYRGTIRHARRWVEMCARDMPHLDVRFVTREGKSILSGLERAFAEGGHPVGPYHFVNSELMAALAGAGAQVIMDGHGGDYTLNPRGQAALARSLSSLQLRRFFRELRGHLRHSGRSLWTTLKVDLAAILLPRRLVLLRRRMRRGNAPAWRDRPVNPVFAERLLAEGAIAPRDIRAGGKLRTDMRAQMETTLRRVAGSPARSGSAKAARYGLELTQPFHDKRVVELALAVPQELYVRDGRNRYLAGMALKDIYPREFQTRWRRNDDQVPDFQRMVKSVEPQILAEIERMEVSPTLARYFDFTKMRALLVARSSEDHNSGWEEDTQQAVTGFVLARYVEWFQRANQ